jgi:hypothetical protein
MVGVLDQYGYVYACELNVCQFMQVFSCLKVCMHTFFEILRKRIIKLKEGSLYHIISRICLLEHLVYIETIELASWNNGISILEQ